MRGKNSTGDNKIEEHKKIKKVIFPIDVYSATRKSSGLDTGNFVEFGAGMLFIVNILIFLGVYTFFNKFLGLGFGFTLLIFLGFSILISIAVFRAFIFKEDSKILEYESSNDLDFSRFYSFRKDAVNKVDYKGKNIQVFEYLDGSYVFGLKIRYGSTDDTKAKQTRACFTELFRILCFEGFAFHHLEVTEDFDTSKECIDYINAINRIEDLEARRNALENFECVLEDCRKNSNVSCTVLLVEVSSAMQKYNLGSSFVKIFNCFGRPNTSIRSIEVFDEDTLHKFVCKYYGLTALDLMSIKQSSLTRMNGGYDTGIIRVSNVKLNNGVKLVNKTKDGVGVDAVLELPVIKLK